MFYLDSGKLKFDVWMIVNKFVLNLVNIKISVNITKFSKH